MAKFEKVYVLRVFNVNGILVGEEKWEGIEPGELAIETALDEYNHADYIVIEERFRKI